MGIKNTTADYRKIIEDPDIDAVLICSSTNTHAQFSREAALEGKHVFCEKPIDTDIERIKETMRVVEKSGIKFQIGFNRRFDHNFKAVKEAVESGKIGKQHIIRITSRDPEPPNPEYVNGAVLVDPEIGKAGDIDSAVISMKFANGAIGVIDNSRKALYGYDQRAEVFGSSCNCE